MAFVWNDKFSFNGYEPADQSANLDAAGQIAVAAQGGISQTLTMSTGHAYVGKKARSIPGADTSEEFNDFTKVKLDPNNVVDK